MSEGDRERWNARYRGGDPPSFRVHPVVAKALARGFPAGVTADLACGASGNALRLAETGRRALAVDIAEAGLLLLDGDAGCGHCCMGGVHDRDADGPPVIPGAVVPA